MARYEVMMGTGVNIKQKNTIRMMVTSHLNNSEMPPHTPPSFTSVSLRYHFFILSQHLGTAKKNPDGVLAPLMRQRDSCLILVPSSSPLGCSPE